MAEKEAQDRAAKSRIVTHMNNDHQDSIIRYLEHYGKVSSFAAYHGKISDVDLHGLTVYCRGKTYRIPLEPPMTSYREARERVVELDRECREALHRSDVTVKAYAPPTGPYAISFVVIASTFLAYSQRWWFAEGGVVERVLGSGFARFGWTIQPWLISALVLIHGAEMVYFALFKLKAHSVNVRSPVWWLWSGSTFIEGQGAFMRFDSMVNAQRQKQRH